MGFWNKVKDFVGIEDDYYEEDLETEEEVVEKSYERTNNVVNNENNFSEPVEQKEERTVRRNTNLEKNNNTYSKSYNSNSDMIVTIKEPLTYEDGRAVMDDIIAGKTVVLNLEMLEMDKKTQIFYFVSGGLYSLKGSMQNVTKDIYVLVPNGVEVDGKVKETIASSSLYQL